MQLCYITDRKGFAGDEAERRRQLLDKIAEAARAGVEYIQLREKDLGAGELEALGREALRAVRQADSRTQLLLNSRADVAVAIGADGVHLRGNDISPSDVGAFVSAAKESGKHIFEPFLATVSVHSADEVRRSEFGGASFAVLGAVFGKQGALKTEALGLEVLSVACRSRLPVFALGGITLENAAACARAGAAGIAAIRMFQNQGIQETVGRLRSI